MTQHTAEEALKRFELVGGGTGDGKKTACAMTALSWVAGEAWSDHPACAHPLLARWAITANDAHGTTKEHRAEIVRAGQDGILDTWWVPTTVVLFARSQVAEGSGPVEAILGTAARVAEWKRAEPKARPDLTRANLTRANLADANLTDANLTRADLGGAKYTQLTIWPEGFDPKAAGAVLL